MARRTLKANCLSVSSLEALVRDLKQYNEDLSTKCEKVVTRLSEIATEVIEKQIGLAGFKIDGTTKDGTEIESGSRTEHTTASSISNQGSKSVAEIKVAGQDILFIEFGAGVHYNGAKGSSPHPKGQQLGMLIGTYGKGMGSRQVWGYVEDGVTILTHGTKATMPMYEAIKAVYEQAPKVVKEVFGK
jgi:hypothetical protein